MSNQIRLTQAEKRQQERRKELAAQGKSFRSRTAAMTMQLLSSWVGEERAKEAAGRLSAALAASASAAKDPSAIYNCTPDSVARCVAVAALTGIMPSVSAGSLAYLVPRSPRKGEQPQLNYQLSHRGMNALAARAGRTMIAIPVSRNDELEVEPTGEINLSKRDIDNPPQDEDQLRGVVVLVKSLETGSVICRGWVPQSEIHKRRAVSVSYKSGSGPWFDWYVEMAMKTAMHYAIARGWCTLDDTEAVRALAADSEGDYQETDAMDVLTGPEPDPAGGADDTSEANTLEGKIERQAKAAVESFTAPEGWEVTMNDCEAIIIDSPDLNAVQKAFDVVKDTEGIPAQDYHRLKKLFEQRMEAAN